jgi:hypothetical protein
MIICLGGNRRLVLCYCFVGRNKDNEKKTQLVK